MTVFWLLDHSENNNTLNGPPKRRVRCGLYVKDPEYYEIKTP